MFVTRNGVPIKRKKKYVDDPYDVWNGEHFELTLRKVCMICYNSDDMIPEELEPMADDTLSQLNMDRLIGPEGVKLLFDGMHDAQDNVDYMATIVKQNIIFITPRILTDENGVVYPTIYDENPRESWINLTRYLKSMFPMPTAGITASAGKTTTTMLAHWALSEKYNVYNSVADGANMNDVKAIGRRWILNGGNDYDLYLQETAMGECRVRDIIRMTDPDVFAVNNIDRRQHIDNVESEEAIIYDKLSYDEVGKEDGVMIINIDDPIIAEHEYKHKTITFALDNKSADCVGKNIVLDTMSIEMDVEYEGNVTHLKANLPGRINAYNMMSAYLIAKQFGVSDEQIQDGFLKYHSRGVRQKVDRVGGKLLYVDCFNYPMEGILTSLDTLEKLELPKKGGRRFAVLTEKDSFDDESYQDFFNYGVQMGKYKSIDQFVLLAQPREGDGLVDDAIYKGLLSVFPEERVKQFPTHEAIAEYLQKETKRGDAILVKGRGNKHMYRILDIAYGTSYSYIAHLYPPPSYYEPTDLIIGRYTEMIGGVSIVGKLIWNQNNLVIPDEINGHKVVRIADRAFAEDHAIRSVQFGKHLRSVGKRTFKECTGIEKIHLPASVMLVDISAFEGCENLVAANMLYVQHVGPGAFKDCKNLRKVVFGRRCGFISESAFKDCPDVTIFAPKGSYAEAYARHNGFKCIQIDEKEEKAKLNESGIPKTVNHDYTYESVKAEENKLTVLACGDVMRNASQMIPEFDEKTGTYSFDGYFKNISAAMGAADLNICNLESTLGTKAYELDLKKVLESYFGGKKTKEFKALKKFNAPEALASVIGGAGFDIAVCANNHANDCGRDGIVKTKELLEKNGVAVSGIKSSPDQRGYSIVEKKGVKIAVLNYAYAWYNQDGDPSMEGKAIDEDAEAVLNIFSFRTLTDDLKKIKETVAAAKEEGADIVIAYYHWGTKNKQHANMLQRYIAHKTAEMGVDAIIGTHPNVLEEKEIITVDGREVPVYYSIGNILSGRFEHTIKEVRSNGCMVKLEFDLDPVSKSVKGIKSGFVPVRTLTDQEGHRWTYTTVDVEDLDENSKTEFGYDCPLKPDVITKQVEESLDYKDDAILCIDEMIEVSTDHRTDISGNEVIAKAIGDSQIVRYVTENSSAGSVMPDGIVIANNPGVTGFMVYTGDGKKYQFMLKAVGRAHRQSFTRTTEYKYWK